ncbi:MAG: hypothetical protein M0017_04605 [Desulfobacteraceae bacterium]|nr:hypothetical protein [Desulfobacteraceae bacterium]
MSEGQCESASEEEVAAAPGRAPSDALFGAPATYRIRFTPQRGIFAKGANPLALLKEIRALGTCRIVAQLDHVPTIENFSAESCYLFWDIILTTDQGVDAIKDVFVEGDCGLTIDLIGSTADAGNKEAYKKLGEILIERGDLTAEDVRAALAAQKRLGQLLVERGMVSPGQVQSALDEQQQVKEARQERQKKEEAQPREAAASLRVPAEKLDHLANLVGKMVTIQTRFTQAANLKRDPLFVSIAEEVERLTNELRDTTLNIRICPSAAPLTNSSGWSGTFPVSWARRSS